ncbi:MAG: hypothetical protein WC959_00490 [Kiritimatiellales bacterium]
MNNFKYIFIVLSLLSTGYAADNKLILQRCADSVEQVSAADKATLIKQLKPNMEVRRFIADGLAEVAENTETSKQKALLRLWLLTEYLQLDETESGQVVLNAHTTKSVTATMAGCFFSQARIMTLYDALRQDGRVTPELSQRIQQVAETYFFPAERGPNNRPLHFAIAQAYAKTLFPQSERAGNWAEYAEAVWMDFYGPGDNYEPGYVAHWFPQILQLGGILGKEEKLKGGKMRAMLYRLRDHVSPSGLVVAPGDGHGQEAYVDGLIAAVECTGDPTLLWAAEKTLLAGTAGYARDHKGERVPENQQREVLESRLGAFYRAGITAEMPGVSSAVSLLYPATYKIPDRLILNPARTAGNPYAALYLNDRQNTTFHGHEDNRVEVYHYEVDGILYLSRSHWSKWPGQANTFVVSDSTLEFPYNQTGGMASDYWYRMSSNLRLMLDYQDSADWQSETPGRRFHETRRNLGYSHTNPDGLEGKCDNLKLNTVAIQLVNFPRAEIEKESDHYLRGLSFDRGGVAWYRDYRKIAPSDGPYELFLSKLFVAGKSGEKIIERFDRISENLKVCYYPPGSKNQEPQILNNDQLLSIVNDPQTGERVLKVICPPGRIDLVLDTGGLTVDLNKEYQRLGCLINYQSDVSEFLRAPVKFAVNGFAPRSMYADNQQGGLLTGFSVEENENGCFGSASYEGVWTYDSSWTRQTLLRPEGILIVVDRFIPGKTADGMIGGPVWQLFSPPGSGLHWFDAAQDFVSGRRLMVYFDYKRGTQYGVQLQPKLWGMNDYAVSSRRKFTAGKEEVFVTVLVPHAADSTGIDVCGKPHYMGVETGRAAGYGITAGVLENGDVSVQWKPKKGLETAGKEFTALISPAGAWQVK